MQRRATAWLLWMPLAALAATAGAASAPDPETLASDALVTPETVRQAEKRIRPDAQLVRMAEDFELWVDPQNRVVVIGGQVCLREGMLEMFACPRGTKEHEAIVSVNARAQFVHAALLAVGARQGSPVQYLPEYQPATGMVVDVFVEWQEEGQTRRVPAQHWIKHVEYEREMKYAWVFAGSRFWIDEQTGLRHYEAEAGDLICVSNFPTATLDVPIKSSQDNAHLLFVAYTERIPELNTPVRLYLVPRLDTSPAAEVADPPTTDAPPDQDDSGDPASAGQEDR